MRHSRHAEKHAAAGKYSTSIAARDAPKGAMPRPVIWDKDCSGTGCEEGVMAADRKTASVHVQLVDGYRFETTFPDVPGAAPIMLDEAPPLGTGAGPTPAGVLAAAIGGCLSTSLTLCLNKAHLEPDAVNAYVTTRIARNEAGRFRIEGIDVDLTPCFAGADQGRFDRCKALYEDFCIVTESVRHGIPVNVNVVRCGEELKRSA